jgi:hypothetical protein
VKTDAEGFIYPSYNATGGASKAMRRGNFHCWDTNKTLAVRLNRNTLKHQIIYMQSTPCHGPMNGQGPEFWGEVQPSASLKGLDILSRRAVFVPWKPSRRPAFGMGNPTFR